MVERGEVREGWEEGRGERGRGTKRGEVREGEREGKEKERGERGRGRKKRDGEKIPTQGAIHSHHIFQEITGFQG